MQIIWSPTAISDLYQAFDYIAQDSLQAAHMVTDRIEAGVERLTQFPEMGRAGRVEGTRELPIPNTSHVVVYRIHKGTLEIATVIHVARKWPDSF